MSIKAYTLTTVHRPHPDFEKEDGETRPTQAIKPGRVIEFDDEDLYKALERLGGVRVATKAEIAAEEDAELLEGESTEDRNTLLASERVTSSTLPKDSDRAASKGAKGGKAGKGGTGATGATGGTGGTGGTGDDEIL